jgi:glycosyltransferase involved in cell wall biosynthesis
MNVFFVNATRTWGGIKTWTLQLGEFLASRGHRVDVSCRPGDALIQACPPGGLHCHPFAYGLDFSPLAVHRFQRLFAGCGTDVVVTNISKELRTGGVAARLSGLAHVNRLGDELDIRPTWRTRLLYASLVDRVFVPSQYLARQFEAIEVLRPRLRVFHNALRVPPLALRPAAPVRFAIVAKLSRRKQVDRVIEAFDRIRDLPWELHVGGFGPELEHLKALSERIGLTDRIRFAGRVHDPAAFLAGAHVGVLFSERDAFPNAVLEYMAASCAVVASRVGGIPEIVTDGVDGLLVDPGSVEQLEAALRAVIRDDTLRERLARSAHETVTRRFEATRVFPAVEAELQALIGERRSGARGPRAAAGSPRT